MHALLQTVLSRCSQGFTCDVVHENADAEEERSISGLLMLLIYLVVDFLVVAVSLITVVEKRSKIAFLSTLRNMGSSENNNFIVW